MEIKSYLTPGQVAQLLMVSPAAVRRWASEGDLNSMTTPGGHRRFFMEEVERFAAMRNMALHQSGKKKIRVLIIDDDIQFSGYLNALLSGFSKYVQVRVANDGFHAGFKVCEFTPDIVLLDLMMPGMDGFEVCRLLKATKDTANIRIIAISGYFSKKSAEDIVAMGAEACLEKPLDKGKLLDLLGLQQSSLAM
ncbi:MAG: response regulator [Gammaproteobacteria bacterium]|nr:response regulator [Gammaproteobacteria bacterium]